MSSESSLRSGLYAVCAGMSRRHPDELSSVELCDLLQLRCIILGQIIVERGINSSFTDFFENEVRFIAAFLKKRIDQLEKQVEKQGGNND